MAITWLADVLRGAGLTVVEHSGWKTRAVSGSWSPQFGIVHATAAPSSQSDDAQIRIVRDGRADLDGPIANACVDRSGRWHVLAAGRCNTTIAGTSGPFEGKGNTYALGVEACHNNLTGTPWPDEQYQSYVRGWAAIARRMGWTADRLRGHKEHTPGHKTDPTFDMGLFRRRVAAVLAGEDNDVGTLTGLQGERFNDMHFALTSVPMPSGERVPSQVALGAALAKLDALAGAVAALGGPGAGQSLMDKLEEIDREATERAAAEEQRDAELRQWLAEHASGQLSADEVVQRLAERLAA